MPSKSSWTMIAAISMFTAQGSVAEPLVGPAVGNADVLISEGNRLYNARQYAKAAENFFKATRADPSRVSAYLSLARSAISAKQLSRACNAYQAYLKAPGAPAERAKAQDEAELCNRQLRALGKTQPDSRARQVEIKARFYKALEEGQLVGRDSALEELKALIKDGYLGVDLADMAAKLNSAAASAGEELYRRTVARQDIPVESPKQGTLLYQVAADTGPAPPNHSSRSAFLDGLISLRAGEARKAVGHFTAASAAEPSNSDYKFYRAMALFRAGDKDNALSYLEKELPGDERAGVARLARALSASAEQGANELTQLLFTRAFQSGH